MCTPTPYSLQCSTEVHPTAPATATATAKESQKKKVTGETNEKKKKLSISHTLSPPVPPVCHLAPFCSSSSHPSLFKVCSDLSKESNPDPHPFFIHSNNLIMGKGSRSAVASSPVSLKATPLSSQHHAKFQEGLSVKEPKEKLHWKGFSSSSKNRAMFKTSYDDIMEEPPYFYLITTYLSYIILSFFGHVRDFYGFRW